MADEPSNGELARRLDEVLRRLGDLVSRGVYDSDQRHWQHRLDDLERDLVDERDARKAAVKELADRMDKAGGHWRQTLFSGVLPALLLLVSLAVQVTLALRSGK